jgi:hypothetical protein
MSYPEQPIIKSLLPPEQSTLEQAMEGILTRGEEEYYDGAKEFIKMQRKFKGVIVDEYTEEGVNKNKEND